MSTYEKIVNTNENTPFPSLEECKFSIPQDYELSCWTDQNGTSYLSSETFNISQNTTFKAQWKKTYIDKVNYVRGYPTTDFTFSYDGWYNPTTGENTRTGLKWVGSEHTATWIAYQACSPVDIMSNISLPTNVSDRYLYTATEQAYVDQSGRLKDRTGKWGCGGITLTKVVPSNNKLVTRIRLAPHSSSYSEYAYGQDEITTENGILRMTASPNLTGNTLGVVGNRYDVTMSFSNGTSKTLTKTDDVFVGNGKWRTVSDGKVKTILEFDFGSKIPSLKLPLGTYTTEITFKTYNNDTFMLNSALLNGFELSYNTL